MNQGDSGTIVPVGGAARAEAGGSAIVAFDKLTGEVRYASGDDQASYASPVLATIGDRRWAFYFARGGLIGFEPGGGAVDFRFPWRAKRLETVNAANAVVVEDQGEGFRLHLAEDREVTERFDCGVVLCGGALRPVGVSRLTGRELHELGRGKSFPVSAAAELVAEVLPSLGSRVPVDIRTRRLPETGKGKPRLVVETRRDQEDIGDLTCRNADLGAVE